MNIKILKQNLTIDFKSYKKNTEEHVKSNIPKKYIGKTVSIFIYIYDHERNLRYLSFPDIVLSQSLDEMIYTIVKAIKEMYVDCYVDNDYEEDEDCALLEHLVLETLELDTNDMRMRAKLFA